MKLTLPFWSSRFAAWLKNRDKNLNTLRTRRAFEVKQLFRVSSNSDLSFFIYSSKWVTWSFNWSTSNELLSKRSRWSFNFSEFALPSSNAGLVYSSILLIKLTNQHFDFNLLFIRTNAFFNLSKLNVNEFFNCFRLMIFFSCGVSRWKGRIFFTLLTWCMDGDHVEEQKCQYEVV